MMQRPYAGPYVRNCRSSVRWLSATPEPAGAANRQRSCVSAAHRIATTDRATSAAVRSRGPLDRRRARRGEREGRTSAFAGLPLAGSMNGPRVFRRSTAESCDVARRRGLSERGTASRRAWEGAGGRRLSLVAALPCGGRGRSMTGRKTAAVSIVPYHRGARRQGRDRQFRYNSVPFGRGQNCGSASGSVACVVSSASDRTCAQRRNRP